MATIKGTYKGNLRNEMTHLQSGNTIITDAPTDNHGKGEAFSPTDLACAALERVRRKPLLPTVRYTEWSFLLYFFRLP